MLRVTPSHMPRVQAPRSSNPHFDDEFCTLNLRPDGVVESIVSNHIEHMVKEEPVDNLSDISIDSFSSEPTSVAISQDSTVVKFHIAIRKWLGDLYLMGPRIGHSNDVLHWDNFAELAYAYILKNFPREEDAKPKQFPYFAVVAYFFEAALNNDTALEYLACLIDPMLGGRSSISKKALPSFQRKLEPYMIRTGLAAHPFFSTLHRAARNNQSFIQWEPGKLHFYSTLYPLYNRENHPDSGHSIFPSARPNRAIQAELLDRPLAPQSIVQRHRLMKKRREDKVEDLMPRKSDRQLRQSLRVQTILRKSIRQVELPLRFRE